MIDSGVTLAAAARATGLSRTTVYRHLESDPGFANRVAASRGAAVGAVDPVAVEDWRVLRSLFETDHTEWGVGVSAVIEP